MRGADDDGRGCGDSQVDYGDSFKPRSHLAMKARAWLRTVGSLATQPFKFQGVHEFLISRAKNLDFVSHEIFFAGLPPSFDGYRIIHISDPHFDSLPGLENSIGARLDGVRADMVVITGDFVDQVESPISDLTRALRRVLTAVRSQDGVIATLGNHDSWRIVDPLEALGVRVLTDESITIRRRSDQIAFTGTDDPSFYYGPALEHALRTSPDLFKIALVHSPELADVAADTGFSLYLTGHTHGGQVCWPNGRPVWTPLHKYKDFSHGLWTFGDMAGYTNAGAGVSGLPWRLFRRGEIALITLRRHPISESETRATPISLGPYPEVR